MSENDWPKTADGVTDWELVFEDEENGLMALVMTAHSTVILKECTIVIIQQLFIREDDSTNIMKYILMLNDIIPDEQENNTNKDWLKSMRSNVVELLRKIKDDRMKKANAFLASKARLAQDRRIKS